MFKYKGIFKPFFQRPRFAPSVKANRAQEDFYLPKPYTDAMKAHWVPPKVCGLAFKGWPMHPTPQPRWFSVPQPKRYLIGIKVPKMKRIRLK